MPRTTASSSAKPRSAARSRSASADPRIGKLERLAEICGSIPAWRILGVSRSAWSQYIRGRRPIPVYIRRSVDAHLRLHALGADGEAGFADLVLRVMLPTTRIGSQDEQMSLRLQQPPEC